MVRTHHFSSHCSRGRFRCLGCPCSTATNSDPARGRHDRASRRQHSLRQAKPVTEQAGTADHRLHDNRHTHAVPSLFEWGGMVDGRRVRRRVIETEDSTPQGAFSPLLANIYLHHVYDQWVHRWRQRCATGDGIVERSVVDEHRHEAEQFLASSLVLG
jgi:hypothetical protein